jgi:16S rRNA G1207 methylase RsmC
MRTSLAEKKARLVFGFTRQSEPVGELPGLYRASKDRPFSLGLADTPNVFSNGKLDIGTRFLFEHFPDTQGASSIIDLGCGNGVIGMVAAKRNPEANVHFVDESYHALAAAHYNVMHNFSGEFGSGLEEDVCKLHPSQNRINAGRFTFNLSHCLDQYPSAEADLVLCNPPFHQGNTIGTRVAEKMFRDSAKVLRKGGELVVIANRHLPYQSTLKRLFGNVTLVSGNQKFVILKSTK